MIDQMLQKIEQDRIPCYFISPHLDDAIFSAGSLLTALAQKTKCTVITVFTEASDPVTISARRFLKQSGVNDPEELFRQRREEDLAACDLVGASAVHLGFEDAIFRKKSRTAFLRFIPEFAHVYPTYRYHILKGRVATADFRVREQISKALIRHIDTSRPYIVFAPLATGNHVDHAMVRSICNELFPRAVYWNDIPYCAHHRFDEHFVQMNGLSLENFEVLSAKEKAIKAYVTQWPVVFSDPHAVMIPEQFAFKEELL